jgi:hypothetical protein
VGDETEGEAMKLSRAALARQVANDNGDEGRRPRRREPEQPPESAPATWRDRISDWIGEGIVLLLIAQAAWLLLGSPAGGP